MYHQCTPKYYSTAKYSNTKWKLLFELVVVPNLKRNVEKQYNFVVLYVLQVGYMKIARHCLNATGPRSSGCFVAEVLARSPRKLFN